MTTRLTAPPESGIVGIQEAPDSRSVENVIRDNVVRDSGGDGIQIQGDNNQIEANRVENSGGYGIYLCDPATEPACTAPGSEAVAENNQVMDNAPGDVSEPGQNAIEQ